MFRESHVSSAVDETVGGYDVMFTPSSDDVSFSCATQRYEALLEGNKAAKERYQQRIKMQRKNVEKAKIAKRKLLTTDSLAASAPIELTFDAMESTETKAKEEENRLQ